MQVFTISRYYLEAGVPVHEKTTYLHGGTVLVRDGEAFDIATDPRAVPLGDAVLRAAAADNVRPNLWFASHFSNSATDIAGAIRAAPNGVVPPGHWFWNPVELGPPRPGVMFIDKGEYDEHCRHMAERAERRAKETA